MNFDLTEERQMLQDTLRRFLADRYTTSVRNTIIDSDTGLNAKIWAELAELGVIGALFSEDQGGFGGAGFDITTVFEELGRAGVVERLPRHGYAATIPPRIILHLPLLVFGETFKLLFFGEEMPHDYVRTSEAALFLSQLLPFFAQIAVWPRTVRSMVR
mgnify:CR=1 FL=1